MEKKFHPAPVDQIGRWVFDNLDGDAIMGLPRSAMRVPDPRMATRCCGVDIAAPLGVAAGPHTQLAHNIVASWLCGARFIELKTVQVLDEIAVARPCIDSADVTFNCEWSQELTLEQSFDQYLAAWVLIHALAHRLGQDPGVMFNMSVGYDLDGIRSDKVQRFLRRMRNATAELPDVIDAVAAVSPSVRDIEIPPRLSSLVTLSTMHGCPPAEIERIARYMLEELGIDTWVKLNPTLLGPELLRGILNQHMGFDVVVEDAAFDHDPKFDDAMRMLRNLMDAAKKCGRSFGLKLSNTLEVSNHRPVFPPTEKSMYMSGRALHPLTVTLAHRVSEALDGCLPISFCGGADAFNFPALVADGLGPITTCTDLLKPGGYARLSQYVDSLARAMNDAGASDIPSFVRRMAKAGDTSPVGTCARENLAIHAKQVLEDRKLRRRIKPLATKGTRELKAFDCIAAPCQEACPTHQDIPTYLRLVAEQRPSDALDVILHTNAMPAVTGRVCDHPCVERCVRNHYDAPIAIRAIKRHAVSESTAGSRPEPSTKRGSMVAVIGAGPAGLSAAYYLARAGCSVTVFESKSECGGMTSAVIPVYRLPDEPIRQDIERVRNEGVHFELGVRVGRDVTLAELRDKGYEDIVLAAGAQRGRTLGIEGEHAEGVFDALEFLDAVRHGAAPAIGSTVLVIGGGNSAMDAARTARRLVGPSGSVTVVYRRTIDQMPADPDEIQAALDEGVAIQPLRAPVKVDLRDGKAAQLVCAHMSLGDVDASGRPRPVAIEGSETPIACDSIIVGISQEPVLDFLGDERPAMWKDGTLKVDPETCETSILGLFAGGDLARGPSTVIRAVADGRRIATAIALRENLPLQRAPRVAEPRPARELLDHRSHRELPVIEPAISMEARGGFDEVLLPLATEGAIREAERCLSCDTMCSLCVTVCPNRANQMFVIEPMRVELPTLCVHGGELVIDGTEIFEVSQRYQVVNVADFCNECGNCTTFCPTAGAPFRDKPRLHASVESYARATYDAYRIEERDGHLCVDAKIEGRDHALRLTRGTAVYHGQGVVVQLDAATGTLVEVEAEGTLAEGTRIDLLVAARLLVLSRAKEALPT